METYNKIKAFVVDDEQIYLTLIKSRLQSTGINNITGFLSGEECVEKLNEKPDVVILDIQLGKLNGVEVLKHIKIQSPRTIVIMFSSNSDKEIINDCLQLGAYDYIEKNVFSFGKLERILQPIVDKLALNHKKPSLVEVLISLFF